ncbi:MAG TPA: glycine cleavage system aminomethyltransferase GcvT [Candidatus Omnitrophota bacterium]|nr:glycine cleavage system aminomethyltransferase GcvT [Candidatus Omnitrophota bacterium]
MDTQTSLKRTPLYEAHLALNAKMVPFGGWEMPLQYEGILAEYEQTRKRCAIFDISHMGEFIVEGDAKISGLERIVTMPLSDMPVRTSRYGTMLNEAGGTIDDCIVFRLETEKWFIVVNGATTEKDAAHIRKNLTKQSTFKDVTFDLGKIDIQGPLSRDILKALAPQVTRLAYFQFDFFDLLGENVLISRTGYTGELGYEIFYPWDKTEKLWKEFLKNDKVKPAGLGARDVLRLEVGYSLYGHELDETINPLEAGLARFVDFNKDFIGKDALLKLKEKGLKRKIVGVISDNRRSPRQSNKIFSENDEEIGYVTSGTFSPSVTRGIGLGFVKCGFEAQDKKIFFGDEKNKNSAMITSKIFYKSGSLKN